MALPSIPPIIEDRLHNDLVAWLCSVRPNGRPHAVIIWFLWDGDSILVFSKPNQQKLRNIVSNPNVLIAMDDSKDGDQPYTIEGTATLVEDEALSTAMPAYAEKYAQKLAQFNWTGESMAREYNVAIRITPTKFR